MAAAPREDVEQSSRRFADFPEPDRYLRLPPHPTLQPSPSCPCDPHDHSFANRTRHAECVAYLANPANYAGIRPAASYLHTGRTIKFRATLRCEGVEALVKVSQHKFLLEPCAEVAAHAVDDALGMRRVPPTAWAEFPLEWLEAATGEFMNTFFVQWVNAFVYTDARVAPLISGTPPSMGVSAALWVKGLRPFAPKSSMMVPAGYSQYLDPSRWPLAKFPPNARHRFAAVADLVLLDYVITNSDRSLFRNNAVGGDPCRPRCSPGEWDIAAPVPATARYVHIDQGSAFYRRPGPEGNPLTPLSTGDAGTRVPICRVRRATWEAVERMAAPHKGLEEAIAAVGGAKAVTQCLRVSQVRATQARLDAYARHFRKHCLAEFPPEEVFAVEYLPESPGEGPSEARAAPDGQVNDLESE